uniref:EGF-like domain-containing protein n=1 Tax=Parascaris equorum TaxID=6256 RepID=A0A914RE42_PAREQ
MAEQNLLEIFQQNYEEIISIQKKRRLVSCKTSQAKFNCKLKSFFSDTHNGSQSCICPARFTGTHCDRCAQYGPKIQPYPDSRHSQKFASTLTKVFAQSKSRPLLLGSKVSLLTSNSV